MKISSLKAIVLAVLCAGFIACDSESVPGKRRESPSQGPVVLPGEPAGPLPGDTGLLLMDKMVLNPFSIGFDNDRIFSWNADRFYIYDAVEKRIYPYRLSLQEALPPLEASYLPDDAFSYFIEGKAIYTKIKQKNYLSVYDMEKEGEERYHYTNKTHILELIHLPLSVRDDHVVMFDLPYLRLYIPEERKAWYRTPVLSFFHLTNGLLEKKDSFGSYPEVYYQKAFTTEVYLKACQIDDTKVGYIFSTEPVLYIAERQGTVQKVPLPLPVNAFRESDPDSITNFSYNRRQEKENEFYTKLLYDDQKKIFYVFQAHPVAYSNIPAGEMPLYQDKPFTVWALDSNYQVIGRKRFPKIGSYISKTFFCAGGSLYLGRADQDRLILERYATD